MQAETTLFKILSDSTRLRLAVMLAVQGETCVCDLAAALGEADFKVSRHLGIMRAAGMVETRREGTWMYYKLVEPRNVLEGCLQDCFRDCLKSHPLVKKDLQHFKRGSCGKSG